MAWPVTVQIVALICAIPCIFADNVGIKWCQTESTGGKCAAILSEVPKFNCVLAPNIYRCMQLLAAGDADVLYVSDTELYPAGKIGLKPLLKIVHENAADYRYKAVAVVKAGGKIKALSDLKNAKSCHTRAGKTTGWTTPVSNLIQKGILTPKDCYSSTENIADFFQMSCVPGALTKRFNPLNLNPTRLCSLCKDKVNQCSPKDEYASYDGARRCLESTDADVAFVKHETMLNANKTEYKLLCPDGKLMDLDQFEECNWAVRPSDTIVVSPKVSNRAAIAQGLIDNFSILKQKLEWKNVNQLKTTDEDFSAIMGEGFKNTFEYYHNCKNNLRWCAISDNEFKKCTDLKLAFMAKRATNKLQCVMGKDHAGCLAMIEQKKADFVVVDGGDLEIAIKNCELEPVIAENYGFETASYFTVAVVKASADFNVMQLKGKKSCHTGIGKTSGWKSPISFLLKNNMIKKGHSIPEEVGKFFNASCVPGALDPRYNPDKHNPKNLCALCPKDSNCERNSKNKYYDYSGAFRCLVETDADVAFVKHTTVLESTDGNGKLDWEKNLKSDDYRLLCKNGSVVPVTAWRECYFAKVPAHAMVTRKSDHETGKLLFRIFNNFDLSSPDSKELLFSSPGGKNSLFKDSTKDLFLIEDRNNYLGKDYLEILKYFPGDTEVCSGSGHSTISVILVLFTLVNYFA